MSSSLELLNPRPWASRKHPSKYASTTASFIQRISLQLMSLASSRKWTDPTFVQYISPDYHAEFDHAGGVPINTWKAYVEHHDRLAEENPGYEFEVMDSVSDVYEKTGTGAVYMLLRVKGHPANVVRESIIVMHWKKETGKEEDGEEKWRCQGQKVVRGMLWNA